MENTEGDSATVAQPASKGLADAHGGEGDAEPMDAEPTTSDAPGPATQAQDAGSADAAAQATSKGDSTSSEAPAASAQESSGVAVQSDGADADASAGAGAEANSAGAQGDVDTAAATAVKDEQSGAQTQAQQPQAADGAAAGSGAGAADAGAEPGAASTGAGTGADDGAPGKELKVEDALLYLDQVKQQFEQQPHVYNQFLDIMKNFKAQEIDTPGVIERVSTLFRGYNDLILGFNTFLPPGYKIKPEDIAGHQSAADAHGVGVGVIPPGVDPVQYQAAMLGSGGAGMAGMPGALGGMPGAMHAAGGTVTGMVAQQNAPVAAGGAAAPQPMARNQPIEFEQAIKYVTTIKTRFADEPDTYKRFLEILHTYQSEAKSIKDVLSDVSQLFGDHPDLLREFSFFLPEAVQPQAQNQLELAAQEHQRAKFSGRAVAHGRGSSTTQAMELDARRRYNERHRAHVLRAEKERKSNKRSRPGTSSSSAMSENRFFEKAREVLPSRELWNELLKCLDLYSHEVLSRNELLCLAGDLFGKHSDMLHEFGRIVALKNPTDAKSDEMWASTALSDMDFSQSRRCTPSYRALPRNYTRPPCSERSDLDQQLLNDSWVSVPTGSEDFSFKNMRRNQFEEALFKVEDERFEIDMVIDSNSSTIRVLEQLDAEVKSLIQEDETSDTGVVLQYRLDQRSLSTVHLAAITRIYGDRGREILELLRKNPAGAIPVILKRMKQKDVEWRAARDDLNEAWEKTLAENAAKALDHRSFYFKQQQKKALSLKAMVEEIKAKHVAAEDSRRAAEKDDEKQRKQDGLVAQRKHQTRTRGTADVGTDADADANGDAGGDGEQKDVKMEDASESDDIGGDDSNGDNGEAETEQAGGDAAGEEPLHPWDDHLSFHFKAPGVHFDVAAVLAAAATKQLSGDCTLPAKWWRSFLHGFLGLPAQWLDRSAIEQGALPPSSVVDTPYGEGVVELVRDDGVAVVHLPFGKAFIHTGERKGEIKLKDAAVPWYTGETDTDNTPSQQPSERHFVGTLPHYSFFRMYCALYARLVEAKELCNEKMIDERRHGRIVNPAKEYLDFLALLTSLVDGSKDTAEYEESCRKHLGPRAFTMFMLEKVISRMVKDLHLIVTETNAVDLQKSYEKCRCGDSHESLLAYETACSAVLLQAEDAYGFHFCEGKNEGDESILAFNYFGPLAVDNVEKQEVGPAKPSDAVVASPAVATTSVEPTDADEPAPKRPKVEDDAQ